MHKEIIDCTDIFYTAKSFEFLFEDKVKVGLLGGQIDSVLLPPNLLWVKLIGWTDSISSLLFLLLDVKKRQQTQIQTIAIKTTKLNNEMTTIA